MSTDTQYEDELRRANEELYKHSLELARLKQALEISREQEIKKAQEVVKLKDEFVFLAVHELRTPIVAIQGFLELTQGSVQNFPQDVQRNLKAISEASTHMSQLINDLLEIARSESGVTKIEVTRQKFRPILDEVLHEVAGLIEGKSLQLELNVQECGDILCDTKKLKEVLENLVGNAIKYNREKGRITINVYRQKGEAIMFFEIRDTGYGIPQDQQDKIFQKFFRAVTSETQEIMGTGLGLFITRMLIEKMGGSLMFSSVEHEGTTFSFSLPIAT